MDEFELMAFVHTADFSSLSKAALYLKVSQPAISRSIRNLEDALNATLLVRHGRGVTLTNDGQRFLAHAKDILSKIDHAKRDLIALRAEPEGLVRFGMPTSVGAVLLPKLTERIRSQYPKITLVAMEAGSIELFEWLLDGRLDVAVIHEPTTNKSLVIEEIVEQHLYLIGRPIPELRGKTEITIEEMAALPLVLPMSNRAPRIALEQVTASAGCSLNCIIEVNSAQLMRALAFNGIGYAMLPLPYVAQDVAEGRLVAIKIAHRLLTEKLCVVTTTFNPLSAATRVVARIAKEEFPSLPERGE